ncbi:hypothetical protein M8C21_013756 [Ambrosia artemisiifolia]|uniref:Uncharacterized protein n=1 Tax=Ambrosia artemisiifolia TaxID=4212 RepID=A0AAD5GKV8_AMBAR|nr:hypothetical protein M8C21_013756 [Ambrosia artemisiifolia]
MAFDFYIFIIFVCFPFYDVFLSFRFENILFICSSQKSREQSQDFKGSNTTSVLILLHLRGWFLRPLVSVHHCPTHTTSIYFGFYINEALRILLTADIQI